MTKIQEAKKIIEEADKIVIGAGAGLSAAAGLTYSGSRFEVFFKDYIARY
ncbi:MAG: Sir2 silent information regulator family NAD-dependent deacetylase, partial [Streptococcus salivarius]